MFGRKEEGEARWCVRSLVGWEEDREGGQPNDGTLPSLEGCSIGKCRRRVQKRPCG